VASTGFSRAAEAYERGRPGYPGAAVDMLAGALPDRASVLDLAAGTGKLTRILLQRGFDVVAVEPVAEMRAALPTEAHALEGTAEDIPLEDGAVDAVTVAQAFHWFDPHAAVPEIGRVLRPGGVLALLWNRRLDDPLSAAIDELLAPYRSGVPSHQNAGWRDDLAGFVSPETESFAHEQALDAPGLEARVGSVSYVASLEPGERSRVLERARALAADGPVAIRYRCEVRLYRGAKT
jgi:SAM-dependent methyltransferase